MIEIGMDITTGDYCIVMISPSRPHTPFVLQTNIRTRTNAEAALKNWQERKTGTLSAGDRDSKQEEGLKP